MSANTLNVSTKTRTAFYCGQCGQKYSKWQGHCTECGEWNTLSEEREVDFRREAAASAKPYRISEIPSDDSPRILSGISEWDRILGGGLVPGSLLLLGGEPGIGKSTLLLQAADRYAKNEKTVLYVSGEESPNQISLRAQRLGLSPKNLYVISETCWERVEEQLNALRPSVLIIDSIQTLYSSNVESQAGTVGQLRACTFQIMSRCKPDGITTFLVGHVTKEGTIAGPKLLEHMVDTVLYFETNPSQTFRLLRAIKNRYGATNEIGVFEITGQGLREIRNPSEIFLAEQHTQISGSVVGAAVEGTRPLLVEVQALSTQSSLAMARRTAIGYDPNRVAVLVAILEKRGGFRLFDQDIYVNIAGGLKISEPALDLAVAAAIISSYEGRPVSGGTVCFGELGLGGEVRSVPRFEERIKEAQRIGMKQAYVPAKQGSGEKLIELIPIDHIQELIDKI